MTLTQQIITVALCALGTMITRFLPFIVFRSDKPTPKYIQYIGNALHLRKKNMLLSIAGGTVCYMLLVQFVF